MYYNSTFLFFNIFILLEMVLWDEKGDKKLDKKKLDFDLKDDDLYA